MEWFFLGRGDLKAIEKLTGMTANVKAGLVDLERRLDTAREMVRTALAGNSVQAADRPKQGERC